MNKASLYFGEKTIFHNIDVFLSLNSKIGLVGYNGCGKSSLLKAFDKTIPLSEGSISISRNSKLARVEQDLSSNLQELCVKEVVDMLLPSEEREYSSWKVDVLLDQLGFNTDSINTSIKDLSGGEYNRLLLARALIKQPDFLLLDEPSNHMDISTILWLENFLLNWKGGVMLVSHDSRLLDNITDTTLILRDEKLYKVSLACTRALQYLEKQDIENALRRSKEEQEIDRITKSSKRLAEWGRNYNNEKFSRKSKSMQKRAQKLKDKKTFVSKDQGVDICLSGEILPSKRAISIKQSTINTITEEIKLFRIQKEIIIKPQDKIALIGANGIGKSTLAHYIYNNRDKDNQVYSYHASLKLGYYDQKNSKFNNNMGVLASLSHYLNNVNDETRIKALVKYGFPYKEHEQATELLSGGQRARLNMIYLSLQKFHFIIFDEPTNHLDMHGRDSLIETLNIFCGGLFVISHNRYFLEQVCNRFFYISAGQLREEESLEKAYNKISLPLAK